MTQTIDEFDAGTSKPVSNVIYMIDHSASMKGEKMDQANHAIQNAAAVASEFAEEEGTELRMREIAFATEARWVVGDRENGVERLDSFEPLEAYGSTNTAAAIDLVGTICHPEILGERSLKPVIMTITDAFSSDPAKTINAVERLTEIYPDNKMIRIAIGVKGANEAELKALASTGTIVHSDGTVEENVPFVFYCDEIYKLKDLLKSLTVSSMSSQMIDHAHDDDTPKLFLDAEPDGPDWDDFSM